MLNQFKRPIQRGDGPSLGPDLAASATPRTTRRPQLLRIELPQQRRLRSAVDLGPQRAARIFNHVVVRDRADRILSGSQLQLDLEPRHSLQRRLQFRPELLDATVLGHSPNSVRPLHQSPWWSACSHKPSKPPVDVSSHPRLHAIAGMPPPR